MWHVSIPTTIAVKASILSLPLDRIKTQRLAILRHCPLRLVSRSIGKARFDLDADFDLCVRIGGKHRKDDLAQWHGDSIAWWDGDTLVVETRAINATQRGAGGTFLSKDGKMIERFSRINDNQILYAFEVDDPTVYSTTWKGEIPLNRIEQPVYEFACHEGNYGMYNILLGGRENDRKGREQRGGESRSE